MCSGICCGELDLLPMCLFKHVTQPWGWLCLDLCVQCVFVGGFAWHNAILSNGVCMCVRVSRSSLSGINTLKRC